ncbi:hypothetical protein NFI95_09880 [Acetobacteraceae bacterium KSS8]|uniref:Glycosyltransferase RgtA/B/C/D-like domain-containing protein n=1 Tax=Endosaccharibacter trunci TaxID=2812733 RepID=A0ABT1W9I5_9PROT|nr:hypothetical protein [Acetobacteraceae bacterium KSS8]
MRSSILALILVVAVLGLCWRHDRVQPLDRYDQPFYLGIAFDLRHHHRFTDGFFFAGGNDRTERPAGMRFTPLYPFLLAVAATIDRPFAASTDCLVAQSGDASGCPRDAGLVRWLQFAMLAATFWMIWWMACRIGRPRTGWIALALVLPTAPLLLLSVDYLMTETVSLFLAVLAQTLAIAATLCGRRAGMRALGAGLALGLATLARPAFELLAGVSILWVMAVAIRRAPVRRPALLFTLGTALPIAGWVARNAVVLHRTALTFGYASHTFVQRLSFNSMSWREYGRSFVCWMPDGNGLGGMLFGRGACDRFGWDDHPNSFYAIGIGPMLRDTLRRAGGWAHHGAYLVRHDLLADPLHQIGWHLAVTAPLFLRGLFVDHWWGFVLSIPLVVVTIQALRRSLGGGDRMRAERVLIVALPGWFMLLVNAAVAVNQTRYNLMLVVPLAIAAALAIDAPRRKPGRITGSSRPNG